MSIIAAEAKPLSKKQIRHFVGGVRGALGISNHVCVDVEQLIDIVLPRAIPQFHYDVREPSYMADKHGEADPADMRISLREDVYDGMVAGNGRDRFTVLHEIGHLFLHQSDRIVLNRQTSHEKLKAYKDPEWQADFFAGEFLAFHGFVNRFSGPREMALAMGLSERAAQVRWSIYKQDGLVAA